MFIQKRLCNPQLAELIYPSFVASSQTLYANIHLYFFHANFYFISLVSDYEYINIFISLNCRNARLQCIQLIFVVTSSKNAATQITWCSWSIVLLIKNGYHRTLLVRHGRPFRIRHDYSREAQPGGGLTTTSYPVGNKTSLSRKPCIEDKKLLWNVIRKSWSLFKNQAWKVREAPSGEGQTMTSYPVAIKHRYLGNQTSQITCNMDHYT